MDYHRFNIGNPDHAGDMNAWWAENVRRGVITTGFDGLPGDRGEHHLMVPAKWDWVLAYVSGKGFVGAGKFKDRSTYKLHEGPPSGTLSDHLHERQVVWKFVIRDMDQAVRYDEVDLRFPVGTRQRTNNHQAARDLIKRLREVGDDLRPKEVQYWWAFDAVRDLGKPSTREQIEAWLEWTHPDADHSDLIDNLCVLSVNDANRKHHDRSRKDFRSDLGHRKDRLFREGRGAAVTYAMYDPAMHGIWDLVDDGSGKFHAVQTKVTLGAAELALAEVREDVYADPLPDFDDEKDARRYEMRSIALREGQPEFKATLLVAYGHACAITGCRVRAILEAAHIRPYSEGGARTNQVNNGLLLRADLHTLFDRGLIWIDDQFRIHLSTELEGSEYEIYGNKPLNLPRMKADHPHPEHLSHHRKSTAGQPI